MSEIPEGISKESLEEYEAIRKAEADIREAIMGIDLLQRDIATMQERKAVLEARLLKLLPPGTKDPFTVEVQQLYFNVLPNGRQGIATIIRLEPIPTLLSFITSAMTD